MIVSITGHTKGLGRYLYDHFSKEHTVVGLSRTTGFNFEKDWKKIVDAISESDLFINNAYLNNNQNLLFDEVKNKVSKIVCIGSQARKYPNLVGIEYSKNKQQLYNMVDEYTSLDNTNPCLHVDLGFMQLEESDIDDPCKVKSPFYTTYKEVSDVIDFWLYNPKIKNIEFETPITDEVMIQLKNHNPDI